MPETPVRSMEQKTIRLQTLVSIGTLIIVLISCGTVVWKQAGVAKTVEVLVADVTDIKINGTSNFRRHEALDEERVSNLKTQVGDMRESIKALGQINAELVRVSTVLKSVEEKLDTMQKSLNEHVKKP